MAEVVPSAHIDTTGGDHIATVSIVVDGTTCKVPVSPLLFPKGDGTYVVVNGTNPVPVGGTISITQSQLDDLATAIINGTASGESVTAEASATLAAAATADIASMPGSPAGMKMLLQVTSGGLRLGISITPDADTGFLLTAGQSIEVGPLVDPSLDTAQVYGVTDCTYHVIYTAVA